MFILIFDADLFGDFTSCKDNGENHISVTFWQENRECSEFVNPQETPRSTQIFWKAFYLHCTVASLNYPCMINETRQGMHDPKRMLVDKRSFLNERPFIQLSAETPEHEQLLSRHWCCVIGQLKRSFVVRLTPMIVSYGWQCPSKVYRYPKRA